jgi:hypothetical protein
LVKIRNQEDEKEQSKKISNEKHVFSCSCGTKILIVSDIFEMSKAIKSHVVEHERITGQGFTQEILTNIIKNLYAQM